MHKRDWIAVSLWLGIAAGLWVIAWIISAAIPVFSNLLSLIVCVTPGGKALFSANLKILDCSVRFLVQLLPGRCLLAVYQQGSSDVLAADDHLYYCQPGPHRNWFDYLWYGSLGVWKGYS
jgi:hypothetical protein